MKCKTCAHPQHWDIDLALLAKSHTLEALSQQYGLSVSSLHRHKRHLVDKLDRARDRLLDGQQLGRLLKLNAILENVQRAVDAAEADGNVDRVIRGAGVGARIIHQMSRMEVPLDLQAVYRIISSPQWTSQDTLLPTDPQLIADLHQALADDALSPCPDPEPERISEISNYASLETRNSELKTSHPCACAEPDLDIEQGGAAETIPEAGSQPPATLNSELRTQNSELLRQLFARLPLTANPETTPKNNREKSAKLPIKMPFPAENDMYNQIHNQYKKCLAKNPGVGLESTRKGGEAQAPPSILASADSAAIASASSQSSDLQDHASRDRQTAHGKLQPAVNPVENQNSTLDTDRPEGETCRDDWNIVYLRNPRRRRGIFY